MLNVTNDLGCFTNYNYFFSDSRYHPTLHNCYDFVLSFLKEMSPECQDFVEKDTFCNTYILPRTTKAAHYIDLYRNVVANGFVVSKSNPPD